MTWNSQSPNKMEKVCFLSTFPPRKCGIAVFTEDLVKHLDLIGEFAPSTIIAVTKRGGNDRYGQRVDWQILKDEEKDYVRIAHQINSSDVDAVNIQHEFGIFGGEWGNYLLSFLENVKKPVVTTLHTVQPDFEPKALNVLREIVFRSQAVVVMGRTAAKILSSYGFPTTKIRVIQHGCPNLPFTSSEEVKPSLNLSGRTVLCTFGLLSRGKGIEYAIQALPSVVAKHPEIIYLIIGETHPEVKTSDDESYRKQLVALVKDLGLENQVDFQNRFLTKAELIRYLQATDVYITPYLGKNQISSGTLIYALGTGKAVVSTPYLHAQEVLADDKGVFCQFRDPTSIAGAVNRILADNQIKRNMEKKAYTFSRRFTWFEVSKKYAKLFKQVINLEKEELSVELSPHTA